MGLISWLIDNGPGSPVKAAKALLRAYRIAIKSGLNREYAMRYAIESRYKIIKCMTQDEIEEILNEADGLGALAFLCYAKENPMAGRHPFMKKTVMNIYSYYLNEAPEECDSLKQLYDIVNFNN